LAHGFQTPLGDVAGVGAEYNVAGSGLVDGWIRRKIGSTITAAMITPIAISGLLTCAGDSKSGLGTCVSRGLSAALPRSSNIIRAPQYSQSTINDLSDTFSIVAPH